MALGLAVQETEGRSEWVGGQMHDHARVSYRVAKEDFEGQKGAQGRERETKGTKEDYNEGHRNERPRWHTVELHLYRRGAGGRGVASRVEQGKLETDDTRRQVSQNLQEAGKREYHDKKSGGKGMI